MTGKQKCEFLKELRSEIARCYGIELPRREVCTFFGDCSGFCPKCDEELLYLTQAIGNKDLSGFCQHTGKPLLESCLDLHKERGKSFHPKRNSFRDDSHLMGAVAINTDMSVIKAFEDEYRLLENNLKEKKSDDNNPFEKIISEYLERKDEES